jgi:hypothetical protein
MPTADLDGNGVVEALTDGILILRRLFAFTGTPLITGVVGMGCTRCGADSIEPYFASILASLDVDGDTFVGALTDGLLILRRLFGFTGTTLTNGAVGLGCSRCDAASIEPEIDALF